MDPHQAKAWALEELAALPPQHFRQLAIEALRRWRNSPAYERNPFCQVHANFGREMVKLLAARSGRTLTGEEENNAKEVFIEQRRPAPWLEDFYEFAWWLFRAGLSLPPRQTTPADPHIDGFTFLKRGLAFLEDKEDHPLVPGFLDRVAERCPGLPDQVTVHLQDAIACLDHGLPRPAIVLIGVAYEAAIEEIVGKLIERGELNAKVETMKAAKRIAEMSGLVERLPERTGTDEQKERYFAALHAWSYADLLRSRRNDGSHTRPRYEFDSSPEIQEYLISAGRHLPALWWVVTRGSSPPASPPE